MHNGPSSAADEPRSGLAVGWSELVRLTIHANSPRLPGNSCLEKNQQTVLSTMIVKMTLKYMLTVLPSKNSIPNKIPIVEAINAAPTKVPRKCSCQIRKN